MIHIEMKNINVKINIKKFYKDLSMCWGEYNYVNSSYMPIVF